jgi:hypothetical protein
MVNGKQGFRIGDHFISFPENEFIKEDSDGNMYAILEIYKIGKDNEAVRVENSEVTPELEEQISEEINKMLLSALEREKEEKKNV